MPLFADTVRSLSASMIVAALAIVAIILGREILQPLAAVDGIELEVIVEVRARVVDGFSDEKMRTVSENARALRFAQSVFEAE